jgi:hypothetical protein
MDDSGCIGMSYLLGVKIEKRRKACMGHQEKMLKKLLALLFTAQLVFLLTPFFWIFWVYD